MSDIVECPLCEQLVPSQSINLHIDSGCSDPTPPSVSSSSAKLKPKTSTPSSTTKLAPLFAPPPPTPSQASPSSLVQVVEASRRRTSYSNDTNHLPPSDQPSSSSSSKRRPPPLSSNTSTFPSKRFKPATASTNGTSSTTSNFASVAPLAERLRPTTLDSFFGQTSLLSNLLRESVTSGELGSAILWGPPGCGKTTLARIIAGYSSSSFQQLSAVSSGINDVKAIIDKAGNLLKLTGKRTLLFVDEIHRFSKSQLDVFLPAVESGVIQLIGATTENPSFSINRALLSRCRVLTLGKLDETAMRSVLKRAIREWCESRAEEEWVKTHSTHESLPWPLDSDLLATLISLADGDCRTGLNMLEATLLILSKSLIAFTESHPDPSSPDAPDAAVALPSRWKLDSRTKEELVQGLKDSHSTRYDRTGESHYDMISALHKSIRGSDGSAAIYWLARMLSAGEDPVFIARRLVVVASEDVGLADNSALPLAVAAMQACQLIGMPECRINLAHLVAFLSEAPKSIRSYEAYNRALESVKPDALYEVPMNIRNAPTKLMKELAYGRGYHYDPDYAHPVHNDFLPPQLAERSSHASASAEAFLQPEGSLAGKKTDEVALKEWEAARGVEWEGRSKMEASG